MSISLSHYSMSRGADQKRGPTFQTVVAARLTPAASPTTQTPKNPIKLSRDSREGGFTPGFTPAASPLTQNPKHLTKLRGVAESATAA